MRQNKSEVVGTPVKKGSATTAARNYLGGRQFVA